MPDRSLDSLSSDFYPLAVELIARVVARGVAVMIVQTSRTLTEHESNLANGTSNVSFSKHLPRRFRGYTLTSTTVPGDLNKADAIDLAPYEVYQLHGPDKLQWNAKDPAWLVIGEEAEKLGLRWGGRWLRPVDPGHAELVLGDNDRWVAERQRPWPPTALV